MGMNISSQFDKLSILKDATTKEVYKVKIIIINIYIGTIDGLLTVVRCFINRDITAKTLDL